MVSSNQLRYFFLSVNKTAEGMHFNGMTLILNLPILNSLSLHFNEILKDQNRFKIYVLLGITPAVN